MNHFSHPTLVSQFLLRNTFLSVFKIFFCRLRYEGVDPTYSPVPSFTKLQETILSSRFTESADVPL